MLSRCTLGSGRRCSLPPSWTPALSCHPPATRGAPHHAARIKRKTFAARLWMPRSACRCTGAGTLRHARTGETFSFTREFTRKSPPPRGRTASLNLEFKLVGMCPTRYGTSVCMSMDGLTRSRPRRVDFLLRAPIVLAVRKAYAHAIKTSTVEGETDPQTGRSGEPVDLTRLRVQYPRLRPRGAVRQALSGGGGTSSLSHARADIPSVVWPLIPLSTPIATK